MPVDQLTDDFVSAYAHWLGVTDGEARALLQREPLVELGDAPVQAAGWDESKHPRHPQGSEKGGEFAAKAGPIETQLFPMTEGEPVRVRGLHDEVRQWPPGEPQRFASEALANTPMYAEDGYFLLTARRDGELVGVASAYLYPWNAEPQFLNGAYAGAVKGGGLPLFRQMVEIAAERDLPLKWTAGTEEAAQLYERLGANRVPMTENSYTLDADEVKALKDDLFALARKAPVTAAATPDWPGDWWIPGPVELTAAGWDPAKHPRYPKGDPKGGEFMPKGSDTFVGLQGFERGPGKVRIEGERPRQPVGEIFSQAPAASLEAAVSDWPHLREQRPNYEDVFVGDLVPTQDVVSRVRVQEYLQELNQDGNLNELLDSTRVVQGDDGRLYIADGHNRVAAAAQFGHATLTMPVIRPELQAAGWDESKHPREPKGSDKGGEFTSSPSRTGVDIRQDLVDHFQKKGVFDPYSTADRIMPYGQRLGGNEFLITNIRPGRTVVKHGHVTSFRADATVYLTGMRPNPITGQDDPGRFKGNMEVEIVYKAPLPRKPGGKMPKTKTTITEKVPVQAAGFDESKHPRYPAGSEKGGQFAPKEGALTDDEQTHVEDRMHEAGDVLGSERDPNWEGPPLHPEPFDYRGTTYDMVENSDLAWGGQQHPGMQYDINTDALTEALGDDPDQYREDVEWEMRSVGEDGGLRATTTFEALESIMEEEPRFKSQFETASSGGVFSPDIRAAQEGMFFGYPVDLPPEQRPVYGWLDHPDSRQDYSQYGEVTWLFKPELKARTTVTFMDSLSRPIVPGPIRNPGWRATPPPGYHDDGMSYFGSEISDHRYETGLFDGDAIETQYHGGVTLDDVQGVRVETASWGSWSIEDYAKLRKWRKQLRDRGIVMEVVDEDGDEPEAMRES